MPRWAILARLNAVLTINAQAWRGYECNSLKGFDLNMRVTGSSAGSRISGSAKSKRGAGRTSGFALDSAAANAAPKPAVEIAGPGSVNGIDALLALQAVPDPAAKRKKAVRRAGEMLDILEDIRIGLLDGRVSETRLRQLSNLAAKQHGLAGDTELGDLLNGIELRVRVELAKLGRY